MRPLTTFPNSSGRPREHGLTSGRAVAIDTPRQSATEVSAAKATSPSEYYRCLLVFDEDDSGQYCLAQAKANTRYAHQVVLIKTIRARTIHTLHTPNPRILSILDAFRSHETITLVIERPGVSLSRILLAPTLDDAYIRTVCREVVEALAALDESRLYLPSIRLNDVSISAVDGMLKIGKIPEISPYTKLISALAADHALPWAEGPRKAGLAFLEFISEMLNAVSEEIPTLRKLSNEVADYSGTSIAQLLDSGCLREAAPAASLVALALVADATVLPDECTLGIRGIDDGDDDAMDTLKLSIR